LEEQKALVIEKNKYFIDMKTSFDEEKAKILEETEVLKNQLKSIESELHRHKMEQEERLKKEKEQFLQKVTSDHLQEIHELRAKYDTAVTTLRESEKVVSQQITNAIEKGSNLVRAECDKVLEVQESRIKDLTKIIEVLKEENKELQSSYLSVNDKILDHKNDSMVSKLDEIKNDFNKFFKDNSTKGIFGENKIEYYLSNNFLGCQIEDTSGMTASGDFLFIFQSLKLLVESKNVQYLKNSEIEKFYRDIDVQVSKGTINSALFISFHDTNLPKGYRNFYFEIRSGIPIVFVSNALASDFFIKSSILMLLYLINNGIISRIESDDDKLQYVINALYRANDFLVKEFASIDKERKLLEQLTAANNERRTLLTGVHEVLDSVFRKYPELDTSHVSIDTSVDSRFDLLVDIICKKMKEQPGLVLKLETIQKMEGVKENNFTNYSLKTYTIKKIKEAVELKLKEDQYQVTTSD
jgi:hypothetical protein